MHRLLITQLFVTTLPNRNDSLRALGCNDSHVGEEVFVRDVHVLCPLLRLNYLTADFDTVTLTHYYTTIYASNTI